MAGVCVWQVGVHGRGDMCGRGGMHGGGHVWQGACMVGGHAWWGWGMCGRGCA